MPSADISSHNMFLFIFMVYTTYCVYRHLSTHVDSQHSKLEN